MSRKPRLGFLGTGWIGRHRMEKVAQSGLAEVVAISDPSPEMLGAARKTVPDAKVVSSFEALLEEDLDGVVIATPSALHAEQSIQALKAGFAVFCQKPLGRTAQEVSRVIEHAQSANRLLDVDLSYRYTDGMQKIHAIIESGEIGDVYAIDLTFHNAYGPDKPWFYDPIQSGGGCVMDLGVHLVDLALWTQRFPKIKAVTSRLYAGGLPLHDRKTQVEDYAIARLDLENGTSVQLQCSWRLPVGQDCVMAASFYGAKGGVALRNVNGSFYDFVAEQFRGTNREVLASPPDAWGGRAIIEWAIKLGASPEFDPDSQNLIAVSRALDLIYDR